MDIFTATPQFKATEQSLLAGLHWQMEEFGCVTMPAGFRVYRGAQADALFTEEGLKHEAPTALLSSPAIEAQGKGKAGDEERTFSGVANVLSISRSGIRLSIQGMDISYYNRDNPVVLANHRVITAELLPGAIGVVERAYKANEQTELRFRNMRLDKDALAEAWRAKVLSGTVRMVSVGFLPLEVELASETIGSGKNKREVVFLDIPASELLEISVVVIGANRGALIGQFGRNTYERLAQVEAAVGRLLAALDKAGESEDTATAALARLEKAAAVFQQQ